jgi:hypothetical protein
VKLRYGNRGKRVRFQPAPSTSQNDFAAGSPRSITAPADDDRLMSLALQDGASKRPSVWHIHIIRTTETEVEAVTDWCVPLRSLLSGFRSLWCYRNRSDPFLLVLR